MAKTFKNFIGGSWVAPSTGTWFENRNPADTRDLIGRFPDSGAADVQAAVRSAKRGFELWRRTPAPARGDVLRRLGDLLVRHKEELADGMTREMGKVLAETRGDVQEGIDTAYYAATEGRRLFGHTVPSELRDKWAMSFRRGRTSRHGPSPSRPTTRAVSGKFPLNQFVSSSRRSIVPCPVRRTTTQSCVSAVTPRRRFVSQPSLMFGARPG